MTVDEFREMANRVTYKGKHCMSIRRVSPELFMLEVRIEVICSRDGSRSAIISESPYTFDMIENANMDNTFAWMRDQIMLSEMHEANENIRIDGEIRFDPHVKPLFQRREAA